ncbi:hypothetical protein HPB48_010577 [Haemaphysalis longicornis]|uniref:Uncharacterized protein n=1 Tax=Haemaphysalis longicornis TaxID=44386 RepID=A0A9J6GTA6_HAELO|nr:hypothetical protein HPB48_010577 [Haemaphysalis longicornis]
MNEVTEMNFPHRCARWQLDSVGEAEVLGGGAVIGRVNIRVTITTMQKVTFYVFGGILTVGAPRHYLSYIERPNPLAEPAECIPDPAMKVYCLCVPTAKGTKYAAGSAEVRTKAY